MLSTDPLVRRWFKSWIEENPSTGKIRTLNRSDVSQYDVVTSDLDELRLDQFDREKPPVVVCPDPDNALFLKFRKIVIGGNRPINFKNCFIRDLEIGLNKSVRVTFKNCMIFRIRFSKGQFEDLEFSECALFNIDGESHAISSKNAFSGRVTISNLWLPRIEAEIFREDKNDGLKAQRHKLIYEFRNIRSYLTKKGDLSAAGIFHAAELSLERKDENRPTRFFSWAYERLSDYGNSLGKALAAFAVILGAIGLLNFLVADFFGVETISVVSCDPNDKKALELIGWQSELCTTSYLKYAVYPFYLAFNPLGVFTNKPLVVSANSTVSIINAIFGIVATIAFALFVLAIRRKFRLEKPE